MSFLDDIAKFRADAEKMETPNLSGSLCHLHGHVAELRKTKACMPPIVFAELAARYNAFIDTAETMLACRWLPVAPPARIKEDGSIACEGHRAALVSFYLGETS